MKVADARADLYSLGAVAWEMLAGAPVFAAKSASDLVIAHLTRIPPPIASRRADTPAPLAAVVMECLAKSPEDRPQSAQARLGGLRRRADARRGASRVRIARRNEPHQRRVDPPNRTPGRSRPSPVTSAAPRKTIAPTVAIERA